MSSSVRSLTLLGVFVIVLLFGISSFVSVAAFTISPNIVSKTTTNYAAGYFLESTSAPGNIVAKGSWTVPTGSSCNSAENDIIYGMGIGAGLAVASDLYCPSVGGATEYFLFCSYNSIDVCPTTVPPTDTMSAGDKIRASLSLTYSTLAVTIMIKDMTKGWTYTGTGTDTVGVSEFAYWFLEGPDNSLPMVFTTVKTTGDSATLGGHTGSLGSFMSVKGDTLYQYTYIDTVNNHTLASTTSIISKSTSFNVDFVQVS